MFFAEQTEVGRLRVRGTPPGNAALRLRLASLLGTAAFRPPGIPPSAVLIVRRLADPLPGRLAPGAPVLRAPPDWERAVQDRLADHFRHAARPVRGWLPAGAEAVVFADEAELLACLALDLVRGEAAGRWWWQAVLRRLRSTDPADRLAALLSERAELVPGVLEHVTSWQAAEPVLRSLSPAQAAAVCASMGAAFGIPALAVDRRQGPPADLFSSAPGGDGAGEDGGAEPPERSPSALRPLPPWQAYLPPQALPEGWGRERACLLGVGLLLARASGPVRTASFQRKLRQWWDAAAGTAPASPPAYEAAPRPRRNPGVDALPGRDRSNAHNAREGGDPDAGQSPEAAERGHPPSRTVRRMEQVPDSGTQAPAGAPEVDRAAGPSHVAAGKEAVQAEQVQPVFGPDRPHHRMLLPPNGEEARPGSAAPSIAPPAPSSAQRDPRAGEEPGATSGSEVPEHAPYPIGPAVEVGGNTRLGGVLYLINLMTALDLPACFEADWRLESEVGPWGVLEVLARALLSSERTGDLAADPLWAGLAVLDGRAPGTLPGAGFERGRRFRLPPGWIGEERGGAPADYRWASRGGQFRLWSVRGYLAAEGPREAAPAPAQARAELQTLDPEARGLRRAPFAGAPLEPLQGRLLEGLGPGLAAWTARVVPYLRCRLAAALGLAPEDRAGLTDLLRSPGRLYLTTSHVDLVLPLEAISLPARVAGLDRDPGWLPAFGRVVQFYFESDC